MSLKLRLKRSKKAHWTLFNTTPLDEDSLQPHKEHSSWIQIDKVSHSLWSSLERKLVVHYCWGRERRKVLPPDCSPLQTFPTFSYLATPLLPLSCQSAPVFNLQRSSSPTIMKSPPLISFIIQPQFADSNKLTNTLQLWSVGWNSGGVFCNRPAMHSGKLSLLDISANKYVTKWVKCYCSVKFTPWTWDFDTFQPQISMNVGILCDRPTD